MLEVQRSDSLRGGEACDPPATHLLPPVASGASVSVWKPAERSVSFNRDVHVKRIGRGGARVSAALVGDGEGRLIATPVHRENIASRSKEELAEEAALVLRQAESVNCVAHDNRRLPADRFSTLPARRTKKRPELPLDARRRSEEIGVTTTEFSDTPRAKKKALDRSGSDVGGRKLKGQLARFFSPKLERKRKPVVRSVSDAGTASSRKRAGSESEGSHFGTVRAKKQLSPIIEASPHPLDQPPFSFHTKTSAGVAEGGGTTESQEQKTRRPEVTDVGQVTEKSETFVSVLAKSSPSSTRNEESGAVIERRIPIEIERNANEEDKEEKPSSEKTTRNETSAKETEKAENVDEEKMLHSSRYDLRRQRRAEESTTIDRMIHRLSNDQSPPPQLTRTMVSPGPGFGHNNNRPFSYTRPNESDSPVSRPRPRTRPLSPPQTPVIYAQVQHDKKKAHRSHSDSDEGLGLERKDSSRENSPAEKEYRRSDYSYGNDLRRQNEINALRSGYDEDRKNSSIHFVAGDLPAGTKEIPVNVEIGKPRRGELDENDATYRSVYPLYEKPERYTSTVFVDTKSAANGDGTDGADSRRTPTDSGIGFSPRQNQGGISSETSGISELSARRNLLESRIKSRLLADEMFAAAAVAAAAAKNSSNVRPMKKSEHEIIDKPIVPSPVTPRSVNRVASPKRYMDTYITETRTSSNGERYIFEKEMHEGNGKVYGYEKKITNKIPEDYPDKYRQRDGHTTVETRTDKYGDKYIVETRTHEGPVEEFGSNRTSPEDRAPFRNGKPAAPKSSDYAVPTMETPARRYRRAVDARESPIVGKRLTSERRFSRSDDFLDRDFARDTSHLSRTKRNLESVRGISKSTQRLDEVAGESPLARTLRNEYTTRSHENLSTHADYVNARDVVGHRTVTNGGGRAGRRSPLTRQPIDDVRAYEDYDTDISQVTSSQLESKYYKETRTSTERYTSTGGVNRRLDRPPAIHQDDYDSSPARIRVGGGGGNGVGGGGGGCSSSRYDSDTTARESVCREYEDSFSRSARKRPEEEPRRSRNRSNYQLKEERSEIREDSRQEVRGQHRDADRKHRETRLSDPDRKDRLADSGIENDYRRDSQEVERREQLESEDESFLVRQPIAKHDRRHTDRNMNLTYSESEQRKYDKFSSASSPLTAKPPSGSDKKYEKKATKKSGTMSKVKQLFSKKEKKLKEEKNKKNGRNGALTDDELTIRYREYRGDQLRSAKSARDLGSDFDQDDYSQRRRLSTPSGSPSPPRPTRLSRSTGTLTREDESFESSNTLTADRQGQEAERKGWFKSLSRKTKSSSKLVDKKSRIPESEIVTTGTEDEEASSAPERVSVQKNLRFFGDTDQESVSSNRDRRNKRAEEHVSSRRQATNRHGMGILSPPRKPPRLAESALSSGESTTGDSSQQSQNSHRSQGSMIYLHAPTVGEIPGPNERRRAASREELSRPLQPHTRTVSRSVSVLAPWKPRHYREPFEITYDQQQHQKPIASMRRRQRSRETLSRRGKDARRSKDNLSKTGTISRSTLKSKDKQKVDRTVSTESLALKSRGVSAKPELSRSTSVPRDSNKSAGWFKLKSKKSRA